MKLTVEALCELDGFKEAEVVAGKAGMSREIANIYFMEVPDIYHYIEKNGLLLTTLFPIANDKEAIEQFIPKLSEIGIAAVAIKPGRFVKEIPKTIVDSANRYQIPVISLPEHANLSTLAQEFLQLFFGFRDSENEQQNRIYEKMSHLLLNGADLPTLITTFSRMLRTSFFVLNQELKVTTTACIEHQEIQVHKTANFHRYQNPNSVRKYIRVTVGGKTYTEEELLLKPIFVQNECLGHVGMLMTEGDLERKEHLKSTLVQAAVFSAFILQKEIALQQKERDFLDSFIRDILNGKLDSEQEIVQKAKIYRWDLQLPLTMVRLEILNTVGEPKAIFYKELMRSGVIKNNVASFFNLSPESCKTIYFDDALICFISMDFTGKKRLLLKELYQKIIDYPRGKYQLGIGISDSITDFSELKKIYKQAKLTVEVFGTTTKVSFIKHYEELGLFRLLHAIKNHQVLEEYIENKLGVLIDNPHHKELLETLITLIRCNGNLQKASKVMFVHYNTLRYRVEKLRELGFDMDDGFSNMEIAVAYEAYLLLKEKKV